MPIAPSTAPGNPGSAIFATARLLGPEDEHPIRQALAKKYPSCRAKSLRRARGLPPADGELTCQGLRRHPREGTMSWWTCEEHAKKRVLRLPSGGFGHGWLPYRRSRLRCTVKRKCVPG